MNAHYSDLVCERILSRKKVTDLVSDIFPAGFEQVLLKTCSLTSSQTRLEQWNMGIINKSAVPSPAYLVKSAICH